MAEKYLFAAEADKIQDTLFRAAAQRQVVGGSRLLVDFGRQAAEMAQEKYGAAAEDILTTGGGSFRILFPSPEQAVNFGRDLSDGYRLLLNASMTITDPVPVNGNFQEVNEQIGQEIRRRKRAARNQSDTDHAPTTAFCESSGVGLAEKFDRLTPLEDQQYLASFAWRMGKAGNIRYEGKEKHEEEDKTFLGGISQYFAGERERLKSWEWANVDDVERIDGDRANIAYLIADGNSMGKLFGRCSAEQLKNLSDYLDEAIRRALAEDVDDAKAPIPALVERLEEANRLRESVLPLLPLILAGDDVFILLPAVYALDFARRFCLAFEHFMEQSPIVQELRRGNPIPPPTMAAAVVFCKGNYPYRLAYQHGNSLLKQAKRLAKTVGERYDEWHSTLAFDLIVGSELVTIQSRGKGEFHPSLNPYWISARELGTQTREASMNLTDLLIHRWLLHVLPSKRIAEARELYAPELLPESAEILRQRWNLRLNQLLDRFSATGEQRGIVEQSLKELGNQSDKEKALNPGHWRQVKRPGSRAFYGHGLPDLINVWEYGQLFDYGLDEYEEGA